MCRDNGPGIFWKIPGPEVERKRENLIRRFKSNGLSITVKKPPESCWLHFEIVQDIYQSNKKPNDETLYTNKNSNHPPTVRKQIAKAISKRISDISSSRKIYDQNISYYKDTLKYYGYDNISSPYNAPQQQGQDKIQKEKGKGNESKNKCG